MPIAQVVIILSKIINLKANHNLIGIVVTLFMLLSFCQR